MPKLADIIPPDKRGYADSSIFVTTEWLAEHMDDPNVQIVDCDLPELYEKGHIPGSVNPIDHYYKTSLEDRRHIQGPEQFAETFRDLGISDDTLVVGYDRSGSLYPFRLAWSLHYYRHLNVKVLDGGFQKWEAEGRATTTEKPVVTKGTFSVRQPDKSIFASRDDVLKTIKSKDSIILDVRTPEERDGSNKRGGKRGGYIPGSVHMEWINFHTGDEIPVIKTAAELRALLAKLGITEGSSVITYCQGGIRAAHAYWILKLLGFKKVRDYDASWREWGSDLSCPIEGLDA